MGFARRVVRKSVRKATPRPVRKAMHPARTARRAVTPRPVRQASRAVYTVTNPLGAAEKAHRRRAEWRTYSLNWSRRLVGPRSG
jgi:hypothetical protein